MSERMIVVDVRLPFRKKDYLKSRPDEKEAFLAKLKKAKSDPGISSALIKLLKDHEVDAIWLQAYRQDPERPFIHANPQFTRTMKAGPLDAESDPQTLASQELRQGERDSQPRLTPSILNPVEEHRAGKSGQIVITAHFPKRRQLWREPDLTKSTTDLLTRLEGLGLFQEHCQTHGYRTINARGQEYDDPKAIVHNSIVVVIAVQVFAPAWVAAWEIITTIVALVRPEIYSFSPTSGPVGTTVAISGKALDSTFGATFNGVAASFNAPWDQFHNMTATVPAGATTGPISVSNPQGTASSSSHFTVHYPPQIDSITPRGPIDTSVTIRGRNFSEATQVTFNGRDAFSAREASAFEVIPDSEIRATVPRGATQGAISVTTPIGTGTSLSQFIVTPTLIDFWPREGAMGASVTISGKGFIEVTEVRFAGGVSIPAPVGGFPLGTDTSGNETIMVTVPVGAMTGRISVAIPDDGTTSEIDFTVIPPPIIISISQDVIDPRRVRIDGIYLTRAFQVTFKGPMPGPDLIPVDSFEIVSDFTITTIAPDNASSGPISVSTPGGTASSLQDYEAGGSAPVQSAQRTVMEPLQITCVTKTRWDDPDSRIDAVGGRNADGTSWKLSLSDAIAQLEAGQKFFVEPSAGERGDVVVAISRNGNKYLKTIADGEEPNNLLSLPDCQ